MTEEEILTPPLRLADETLYEERRRTHGVQFQSLDEYTEAQQSVDEAIAAYLAYMRSRKEEENTLARYDRYFSRLCRLMPALLALDFDR